MSLIKKNTDFCKIPRHKKHLDLEILIKIKRRIKNLEKDSILDDSDTNYFKHVCMNSEFLKRFRSAISLDEIAPIYFGKMNTQKLCDIIMGNKMLRTRMKKQIQNIFLTFGITLVLKHRREQLINILLNAVFYSFDFFTEKMRKNLKKKIDGSLIPTNSGYKYVLPLIFFEYMDFSYKKIKISLIHYYESDRIKIILTHNVPFDEVRIKRAYISTNMLSKIYNSPHFKVAIINAQI